MVLSLTILSFDVPENFCVFLSVHMVRPHLVGEDFAVVVCIWFVHILNAFRLSGCFESVKFDC